MDTLTLRPCKAVEPGVAALISAHFDLMRASSPEESCHVMPADALDREGVWLVAAEQDGKIVGIGGVKAFQPGHFEIKSMHTSRSARGSGVARKILRALITHAKSEGARQISLETGSFDLFAPARGLYASEGFLECAPFGDYAEDPLSTFMTREV